MLASSAAISKARSVQSWELVAVHRQLVRGDSVQLLAKRSSA